MVDNNYVHILAIVDKSGSMHGVHKQMEEALNSFFKEQAEVDGKCLVDYVQFSAGSRFATPPVWNRNNFRLESTGNNGYEKVYEDRPVGEAEAVIQPGGGTALLDAIGRGTVELGRKLKALPEVHRPGKVMVVVVTDGEENSSLTYTKEDIKALLAKQQEVYSWDYVFLGANIDAVAVGAMYGFQEDKSMQFNINNDVAIGSTTASLSAYTTSYRGSGVASFTSEDRANAMKS